MKKLFLLLINALLTIPVLAQMQDELLFTGSGRLGINGMGDDFWADTANDTLRFRMTSANTGDITLPAMHYTPMNMTMQGFTLKDAKYSMTEDKSIVFEKGQTFEMTITDNGTEKEIKATLDSAKWSHSGDMLFSISVTFTYGRMPMPATYTATLPYNREATGISEVKTSNGSSTQTFDMQGRRLANAPKRGIVIKNGKKFVVK